MKQQEKESEKKVYSLPLEANTAFSLLSFIKTDSTVMVVQDPMVWKIEEENLGKLILVLRKAKGIQFSVKRSDPHMIELMIVGTLFQEELKALSTCFQIPEFMVKNWFRTWIKQTMIPSKQQLASNGTEIWNTEDLLVYEFSLVSK